MDVLTHQETAVLLDIKHKTEVLQPGDLLIIQNHKELEHVSIWKSKRADLGLENRISCHFKTRASILYNVALLKEARHAIASQYQHPFNLDQIAIDCGSSKSKLSRLFKRGYGMGTLHYHHIMRLTAACRQILCNQTHLTKLAYQVGYVDLASFSKAFKKYYGRFPRHFIKQIPN